MMWILLSAVGLVAALGVAKLFTRWLGRPIQPPDPIFEVRLEPDVLIPMRDGVRLATDLYFPVGAPEPLATILMRTPYDRTRDRREGTEARIFAGQGYVVAVQDVRGRFASEGEFQISSRIEATDGYDTLSWLAEQDWSNGRIGTYGCSYLGEVQYMLAALRHPAHRAAIAQSGAAWGGGDICLLGFSRGGALELAAAFGWFRERGSKVFPVPPLDEIDYSQALRHLPVVDMMSTYGGPPSDFELFASRPPGDPYWDYLGAITGEERFDVPTLHVNSWYDITSSSTLALYQMMRRSSVSDEARDSQYLLMSPASHCGSEHQRWRAVVGARRVGDPRFDYYGLYLRFFDHFLRDASNGIDREPRVRLYVMGEGEWRDESEWPLARTDYERYYLHSGGHANTRAGDGSLSTDAPGDEPPDTYVYDPSNPVVAQGITCCISVDDEPGGFDQSTVEERPDVLVYSTPTLDAPLEVTGPIHALLYVSSSARDTDFTAKLIDVYPDGTAYNVQEGIFRARYREGFDREVWLEPDEVVELRIDLEATSNVFEGGHQLRLEVSSSNFPRWERNLNTGGRNFDESSGVPAHNTIHHSAQYPSYVELPIIP